MRPLSPRPITSFAPSSTGCSWSTSSRCTPSRPIVPLSPDPDLGLLGLRRLSSGDQRTTELVTAFRESPEVARRLCVLLGTSRLFADTFEHNPDELLSLGEADGLAVKTAEELASGAAS